MRKLVAKLKRIGRGEEEAAPERAQAGEPAAAPGSQQEGVAGEEASSRAGGSGGMEGGGVAELPWWERGDEPDAAAAAAAAGGAAAPGGSSGGGAAAPGGSSGALSAALDSLPDAHLDAWSLVPWAAARYPTTLALVDLCPSDRRGDACLTYAQLADGCSQLADGLWQRCGLRPGVRVGVMLRNCGAVLTAHYAAAALHGG
ncbi:hypothetical protein FOA52_015712 [Chlamydomonas sp. UWO 241]|nr:hypothetical protein FOA52_015712 [Chlamydomonas sp. UWO 241]